MTAAVAAHETYVTTYGKHQTYPTAYFVIDPKTKVGMAIGDDREYRFTRNTRSRDILAVMATPALIEQHRDTLTKLTVDDLLGEKQYTDKLPRDIIAVGINPRTIISTYAEYAEQRVLASAEHAIAMEQLSVARTDATRLTAAIGAHSRFTGTRAAANTSADLDKRTISISFEQLADLLGVTLDG